LLAIKICDLSDENNIKNIEFKSSEIGEKYFGCNIRNQTLHNHLNQLLLENENITMIDNDKFVNVKFRTNAVYVELESGKRIKSKLLIGADGKNSSVREKLLIETTTKKYNQHALAFTINHKKPHSNVSIEIYKSGGPFTIVPLSNPYESAVIWMENTKFVQTILKLDKQSFNKSITDRSGNCLGELNLTSALSNWPIINQLAKKIVGNRSALIAEAAHVLPPIGAQGLNMSIQDIKILAETIEGSRDPGCQTNLITYEKTRMKKIVMRSRVVNGLNLSSIPENSTLQKARSKALDLISSSSIAKNMLINIGLG
jgi:2-octaprenyl-6-methoxyphenol hydroxylase